MTVFLADADVTLHHGDVLDVLRGMEAESVDCVVTSPPYWGLRSYLDDGHDDKPLELGLEATPELFVERLVAVFREVRRVLAPHGTCWVNLGDSYASSNNGGPAQSDLTTMTGGRKDYDLPARTLAGLKPKDLVGIPWRVAFALQQDGWWLRSDIVWAKPNPMPESVTDRPTKSHEFVFLLTKAPRYFFDQEAVREGLTGHWQPAVRRRSSAMKGSGDPVLGTHRNGAEEIPTNFAGRNIRSVWTVATRPYPEAHFATYPEELVRRCVLAGCPVRVCRVCGKPSERIVDVSYEHVNNTSPRQHSSYVASQGHVANKIATTLGWSDCGHNTWRPGRVLDPFVGSGTSCKVARDHGRHSIGIDLNAAYLELAATRLQQQSIFSEVAHDG